MTRRTYIYGSCVTRDGVPQWADYDLEFSGYIARQSLISTGHPAPLKDFATQEVASSFQRRMAESDIRGDAVDKLVALRGQVDLIIWDLTDERLGVSDVPNGGRVTRSLPRDAYRGPGALAAPLTLGSPEHLSAWSVALDSMLAQLASASMQELLVVNATPWALRDELGSDVESRLFNDQDFNSAIEPYYQLLDSAGVKIARPDAADILSRSDHQWGRAAFHYTADSYAAALEKIVTVS